MSTSPVLSYKKPSTARQDANGTPATSPTVLDSDGKFESRQSSGGTRKISSRRKALQDFYHIQQQRDKAEQESNKEPVDRKDAPVSSSSDISDVVSKLHDPDQLNQFLQNTPMEEILKLRNRVTSTLNSLDSEKKTIIYDNYFELIKLSKMLDDITNPQSTSEMTDSDLKVGEDKTTEKIDQNYIYDSLYSLKDFLDYKMAKLDQDFSNVVVSLQAESSTDADSTTGVKSVTATDSIFEDHINKQELVEEINLILKSPKTEDKDKLASNIDKLVKKLDSRCDKLLILELQRIKNDI